MSANATLIARFKENTRVACAIPECKLMNTRTQYQRFMDEFSLALGKNIALIVKNQHEEEIISEEEANKKAKMALLAKKWSVVRD